MNVEDDRAESLPAGRTPDVQHQTAALVNLAALKQRVLCRDTLRTGGTFFGGVEGIAPNGGGLCLFKSVGFAYEKRVKMVVEKV